MMETRHPRRKEPATTARLNDITKQNAENLQGTKEWKHNAKDGKGPQMRQKDIV